MVNTMEDFRLKAEDFLHSQQCLAKPLTPTGYNHTPVWSAEVEKRSETPTDHSTITFTTQQFTLFHLFPGDLTSRRGYEMVLVLKI